MTNEDIEEGYTLACQSVIESDVSVYVPEQEKIERRLVTDLIAKNVLVPENYDGLIHQSIKRMNLDISPPTLEDQTDDWGRLQRVLRKEFQIENINISLELLVKLGNVLRESDWKVHVILDIEINESGLHPRLIDILPGHISGNEPLWGIAIDIGTTTVSVWLTDLISGEVKAQVAEYNQQITRGEDVISRIIYANKNNNKIEMADLVIDKTINLLIETACKRMQIKSSEIYKATISGNSTMIHLLLKIPTASIRLSPFVTAINEIPLFTAEDIGIDINPGGTIDCLPGVASYVGADITAGVLSSKVNETDKTTLFMDVGTNGEIVLGSKDWLVTCACSAGPAFEGAGVIDGMRATKGAIEEVWISNDSFEPNLRVIGNTKPKGICGSGLISLLSELFLVGLVDKAGNIKINLPIDRVREGEHGAEYVVVWGEDSATGADIAINKVDIDNLLRAKAAIYAGFSVLAEKVGVPLETVEQVLIGGSFGQYINVEKAIQIGLLPDLKWEQFHFLGNTSVQGAYKSLLDWRTREKVTEIASKMTYIELSADNKFYDAFMSAMFLPHTDLSKFPSVEIAVNENLLKTDLE
ncbi:MAG: DUF4445 domain-containing protein [Chloroflexi bacterium]|nr:DUF4445 domain-containing protein [Chloroflexota bacterium]